MNMLHLQLYPKKPSRKLLGPQNAFVDNEGEFVDTFACM